ncbi:Facilitated trehalose transporter Tret1 [Eumeta japonica]|uniref:Facilitated trehalose transporter Tret1 n=1 Tax=Eumeta variegata TaxID=151549 RepID=A0A4C1U8E9_EUMVA|nr:Facilitated trehalose transporter Tret1 [Eumeta japonica]
MAATATAATAITRLVVTVVACVLLLKVTRRALVLVSGAGTAAATLALAVLLSFEQQSVLLPLGLILVYVAFNTLGFFLLPGLMIGELLPTKVRGLCGGYIFCLFNVILFGFTKLFPVMNQSIGMPGMFGLFGVSAAIATLILFLMLPETKGKSLIQIEQYYQKPNILWVTRNKTAEGQSV